jgi:hypothetical protein
MAVVDPPDFNFSLLSCLLILYHIYLNVYISLGCSVADRLTCHLHGAGNCSTEGSRWHNQHTSLYGRGSQLPQETGNATL